MEAPRPKEYKKQFQNHWNNYKPIMNKIADLEEKYPNGMNGKFPVGWEDPLELFGCYADEFGDNGRKERQEIIGLLKNHSPKWIWKNRIMLVAERLFIKDSEWKLA